jgi:hypothetical protein
MVEPWREDYDKVKYKQKNCEIKNFCHNEKFNWLLYQKPVK